MGFDGFEDGGGALDGGGEEVTLVVLDVCDEGGGGVDYAVDAFDCFIEGSFLGDVLHDGEGKAGGVIVEVLGVEAVDFAGAGVVADGAADGVAALEETVQDVGGYEAGGSGEENQWWVCGRRHLGGVNVR